MQGFGEQGVRAERAGEARGEVRRVGQRGGDVVVGVQSAGQQQGYGDGLAVQLRQGVREQGRVQLDVTEADGEAGAQFPYPVQEGGDGAQRGGVTAAVRHG
ncbi:hypothetical protein OEIGOIKO_05621 [Streptomyces chrestomyceticus JCM 4735]|uniref:Uncharacterized protein n=1 Tax=Streptomyces chrestomyceticus JCM 4735 TaxID=1306181 RepID=A0A7U9KYL3_9ACTN|nr:hypothetical protein OEIGOIKO_05621 [Streptomyces chrestomyceticus JCM 4735]